MFFWITAGAMTAIVAAVLVRAGQKAARATATGDGADNPDLAVYRAQLAEVERDLARGNVGAEEAKGLRTEIARRILDLDRAHPAGVAPAQAARLTLPLGGVALAILAAFALYTMLGAPGYPDLPHADRVARADKARAERPSQVEAEAEAAKNRPAPPAPDADNAALMDRLRATVAKRPTDETGLRLLSRNERALGNLAAAAAAQERLLAVLGNRAAANDWAELADDYVFAAGGIVTPEADRAIAETLKRDPANGTARFYTGLMEAQTGRPDRAFTIWDRLLSDTSPDAPWVPYITQQMPMLAAAAGTDWTPPAGQGGAGPGAADMQAAAGMSEGDRSEMIKGMVGRLEERLRTQGGSPAEWAQLIKALGVLKDEPKGKEMWALAQKALAADPAGLDQVRQAATEAGFAG